MIAAPLLSLVLLAPSSGATPPALDASSPKAAAADGQEPVASTSVGMRVRIEELPIAGPKLQARPVADPGLATAIVRVLNVFPHGTGWRYNLEVTPFEEGTLDLAALLEPAEAGAPWDPPVLEVEVEALLAPEEVEPSDLDVPVPESVGGYRTGMTLLAAAWLAGLLALLTVGRRKDERATVREAAAPVTLADRLAPLVARASTGDLSTAEQAQLERLLLAHWRDRRDLGDAPVARAVAALREDPEAGPLFVQLERWLHRPGTDGEALDLDGLLAPYRGTPAHGSAGPGGHGA